MDNTLKDTPEVAPVVKIAATIIILGALIYAKTIVVPILLALFISIICEQPITWLEKRKIPRGIALLIVLLGMIVIFTGFGLVIGGTISSFSGNLSKYQSTLTDISTSFIQSLNNMGLKINNDQISNMVQPGKILEYTATFLNTVFNMVGNTFLVLLIVIFILLESTSFSVKADAIRTESGRSTTDYSVITQNIRHYLAIKTILCIATGVLIYFSLLIIGVDYPLLWGLIAGLLYYIPNIGSIIATIPTVLFALIQLGVGGALWTLGITLVIHNILGNFFEPKIMGRGMGLSTLVVFISLLVWGFAFGLVGMFLSVPITMAIKIILEQNEKTKWMAVLLGTAEGAQVQLKVKQILEKED